MFKIVNLTRLGVQQSVASGLDVANKRLGFSDYRFKKIVHNFIKVEHIFAIQIAHQL